MNEGKLDDSARPTVYSELLTKSAPGAAPPTSMDLADDAYSMLAAAADTTGNTMTKIVFNVMNNRKIYDSLRTELLTTFPDENARLDFLTLEKLPYLVSA